MRCVVDLQGAQNESRYRGIGRYCTSLTLAMARQPQGHELWLAMSSRFSDQVGAIRAAFDGLVPREHIVLFEVPTPCAEMDPRNGWRARAAEKTREGFLEGLRPDVVFVPSLFEGWCDDSVTSVGAFTQRFPTAVVLYDLIPLLRPDECLPDDRHKAWYRRKLRSLGAADLLTAISESARLEAIEHARISSGRVVNIGCGIDPQFQPQHLSTARRSAVRAQYGIVNEFIMYSGATDSRKNLEGLIAAFALLPSQLKQLHQLVIAGAHDEGDRNRMRKLAEDAGLRKNSLVFTGYVPDQDLVALYSECALFVLPSFHEGFGLPAAEAMACGAPTIGADATSIPEVIGRQDALFDPRQPPAIAAKMEDVLGSDTRRQQLREHGLSHSRRYTWEKVARASWDALEELHEQRSMRRCTTISVGHSRKRLAYFSPLPPVPSGIADYSVELLPELSRYFDIEVVVFQPSVSDKWVETNCAIRTPADFEANPARYDRVLYHMGNSPFHTHMWKMMERYPGTVVVHDFYQSNLLNWVEREVGIPGAFSRALYQTHGYTGLLHDVREGRGSAMQVFPCNRHVIEAAAGIIVHSNHSKELAERWYGPELAADWVIIPHLRTAQTPDRRRARERFGFSDSVYVVCSFGMIADTKLNHRLVEAWSQSALAHDKYCKLIFVGETHCGQYGLQLQQAVESKRLTGQVQFTGFADVQLYRDYLAAADQAVQLRTNSRGETSGTVLDCLAYDVPTIVNAHGSLRDLPDNAVLRVPDEFEDRELAEALELLRRDSELRCRLRVAGRELICSRHEPARIAEQYWRAIEGFSDAHPRAREEDLIREIVGLDSAILPDSSDLAKTATAVANNRVRHGRRQLLVDISATAKHDLKTGIERVARAIIMESIEHPPEGFRTEPVRGIDGRYTYARNMTLKMVGGDVDIPETPVEIRPGDVYLAMDWSPEAICASSEFFSCLRSKGVPICFMVHDLLPLKLPHRFPPGTDQIYREWLEMIVRVADKLIAVSRAIADEIIEWLGSNPPERLRPLQICYSHHGADIAASAPSQGLAPEAGSILCSMRARPSFLMVGTMEPRKGHGQVLGACEQLWSSSVDVNLVIVGKQGWMMESLAQDIRQHPEHGKRLFWLVGISDEMLLCTYENAAALIAASEGEGFGLPLIEAARARVPIIARDLAVFREIGGENAFYFSGATTDALASDLRQWLNLFAQNDIPRPEGLMWSNWKQSTRRLIDIVMGEECYREWPVSERATEPTARPTKTLATH